MIRLYKPSTHIMIAMFGCDRICGPTAWQQPSLTIDIAHLAESDTDMNRWSIRDDAAAFSVEGNVLYWGKDVGMFDQSGWFTSNAVPNRT